MNAPCSFRAPSAVSSKLGSRSALSWAELRLIWIVPLCCAGAASLHAQASPASSMAFPNAGSTGPAFLRVFGALALVLGLFFAGLWLWRNWQRFATVPGRRPKLAVVEAKSLGPRHTLYVVGYEDQRMLIAASPTGVSMLTHLPLAQPEPQAVAAPTASVRPRLPFAALLRQALSQAP